MTEETTNLLLEHLRQMQNQLDRIGADIGDLKVGMSAVEIQVAAMSPRLERVDMRLSRVERRLELAEA